MEGGREGRNRFGVYLNFQGLSNFRTRDLRKVLISVHTHIVVRKAVNEEINMTKLGGGGLSPSK